MSRTDRRRHRARPVAEALKSVLIVILALNAVYLTALAISAGTPGGGSPAGTGAPTRYTREQIARMTPQEINAHWDDVSASLNS